MGTINTADNLFGVAKWIVDPVAGSGTHTTISGAITDASAGDTIFIRPGTYTENITVSKKLYFTTFTSTIQGGTGFSVILNGSITMSTNSVTAAFTGIQINTNSANIANVSANSCSLAFRNCVFNVTSGQTGLNLNTGTTSNIYCYDCYSVVDNTGILFSISGTANNLFAYDCEFSIILSGTPSTSTIGAGCIVSLYETTFNYPISTSSSGLLQIEECQFGSLLSPFLNTTWITTAGTGTSLIYNSEFYSGTASALSIGTGTTIESYNCVINSTNTNPITGSGTFKSNAITYNNTGIANNTTTRTFVEFGERGTFTPNLTFGGGSTGILYTLHNGFYLRIGNQVTFTCQIQLSAKGSSTGAAAITGLPYTVAQETYFACSSSNLTFGGQFSPRSVSGSTNILVDSCTSGGGRSQLTDTAFSASTILCVSGTYLV